MASQPLSSDRRHAFPVARASPFSSSSLPILARSPKEIKTTGNGSVRRHESFNAFDVVNKTFKGRSDVLANVKTQKSDKKLPRRTSSSAGSLGRSGWSRHSLDAEEGNNTIHDVRLSASSVQSDIRDVTSFGVSDVTNSADEITDESKYSDKENSPLNSQRIVQKEKVLTNMDDAQFESGCRSLPITIQKHAIKTSYTDDQPQIFDKTSTDSAKERRELLKKRMQYFEILPNFRRQKNDSSSHSSFDQSDDTLSDGAQTVDFEEVSTSFSVRHETPSLPLESQTREIIHDKIPKKNPNIVISTESLESKSMETNNEVDISTSKVGHVHRQVQDSGARNKESSSYKSCVSSSKQFRRRASEPLLRASQGDTLQDPLAACQTPDPLTSPRSKIHVRATSGFETNSRDLDRPMSAGTSGYSTDEYKVWNGFLY